MKQYIRKYVFCTLLLLLGVSQASWGANFTQGSKIYLNIDQTPWENDGAEIVAIFYYSNNTSLCYETNSAYSPKNSLSASTSTTKVADKIFEVTVPNAIVKEMYFIRKKGTDVWNYSAKMSADNMGSNNCVKLSGWDNSSSWSTYSSGSSYIGIHTNIKISSWKTHQFSVSDNMATYTFTDVSAGDYEFGMRIGQDDNWTANGSSITRQSSTMTVASGGANNKFKADVAGDYTFTYNLTTKLLAVTYPGIATYTVTFNANGHGTAPSAQTVNSGDKAVEPTDPTADGYTFGGWYTNAECTGTTYDFNTAVTSNLTLYAKWTAIVSVPDYYYRGTNNSWGNGVKLTSSPTGLYAYREGGNEGDKFKISKSPTSWDYNSDYIQNDFVGADIELKSEGKDMNIESSQSGTWYILVWYPTTDCNSSDEPVICASTTLPTGCTVEYAIPEITVTTSSFRTEVNTPLTLSGISVNPVCSYLWTADGGKLTDETTLTPVFTAASAGTYTLTLTATNGDKKATANVTIEVTQVIIEPYPVSFGVIDNQGGALTAKSDNRVIDSGDAVMSATFTAVPETGYAVEGWYNDIDGNNRIEAAGTANTYTLSQVTEDNSQVYVRFCQVATIYFKPNDQNSWGSKWVYVFSTNPWNDDKLQPKGKMLDHGQMTEENGLYSYRLTTPLGDGNYCFAFNWSDQSGNKDFYDCEAVYRSDFHKDMPVYISEQGQGMTEEKNKVRYYNKGVWMRYNDVEPGYDLGLRNQKDDNDNMVFHRFKAGSRGSYVSTVSVMLEADKTYSFLVRNDKPYYFKVTNPTTCTPTANHFALFETGGDEVVIRPTQTGIYTFQLNLANGKVEIDVLYPSITYRLVYAEKKTDGEYEKYHPSSPSINVVEEGGAQQNIVSLHVRCSIPDFKKDDLGHTTEIIGWKANTNSRYVYLQMTEDGNTWTTVDTKDITTTITKNGVYNFVVEQDETGAHIGERITEYTGGYYIRTNLAEGGWNNYTAETNQFTYSDYAAKNRYFDHYWCKYHNGGNLNLSFVVANDYSLCISDTCVDEMDSRDFTNNGIFDKQANIRFSWSSEANTTDRAYIAGAGNNLWLLTEDGKITSSDRQFSDRGNWVYYLDATAQPDAMIGLKKKPYNGATSDYYVIGSDADHCSHKLLSGTGRDSYHVRILYDFKSDHLIYGWMPDESETIVGELPLDASVVIVREGHGKANQLSFQNKDEKEGAVIRVDEALGVLTIKKSEYIDQPNPIKRDYYWISFPFDVEVSDIFSAFVLNKHFWIQEYDGASRAKYGCFANSPSYWKSLGKGDRLHKGQGYVVYLEHDAIKRDNLYAHTDALSLYFPSTGLTEINGTPMTVKVPEHPCTITEPSDRTVYDSNWNLIGVSAWADISALSDIHRDNPEYTDVLNIESDQKVGFYYYLNTGEEGKEPNTWTPQQAEKDGGTNFEKTFKTMYSYLVQWHGTITWTASVTFNEPGKQALRALRAPEVEQEQFTLRLELERDGVALDQTFVRLQESENVTADYDMNYDMTKMLNAGCGNIYSLAGDRQIQVAANVQPVPKAPLSIPIGVSIATDGEYTFALPDGTEGMSVVLIDTETGIRTNLLFDSYTVTLAKGTYEQRFVLEVNPKQHIITASDNVGTEDNTICKYLIDGNLYIRKADRLYDVQGRQVRAW